MFEPNYPSPDPNRGKLVFTWLTCSTQFSLNSKFSANKTTDFCECQVNRNDLGGEGRVGGLPTCFHERPRFYSGGKQPLGLGEDRPNNFQRAEIDGTTLPIGNRSLGWMI